MSGVGEKKAGTATMTAVLAILAALAPADAAGRTDQLDLQVKVLMRALTYETRLRSRPDPLLRVAVVFDSEDVESVRAAGDVIRTLEAQGRKMTFMGRPIVVLGLTVSERERLRQGIGEDVSVVFLAPGLDEVEVRRVVSVTRGLKVVTVCGTEKYIDWGTTLAVTIMGGKPRILVNESAARAEGAEFSSQLLQLADVRNRKGGHGH